MADTGATLPGTATEDTSYGDHPAAGWDGEDNIKAEANFTGAAVGDEGGGP